MFSIVFCQNSFIYNASLIKWLSLTPVLLVEKMFVKTTSLSCLNKKVKCPSLFFPSLNPYLLTSRMDRHLCLSSFVSFVYAATPNRGRHEPFLYSAYTAPRRILPNKRHAAEALSHHLLQLCRTSVSSAYVTLPSLRTMLRRRLSIPSPFPIPS